MKYARDNTSEPEYNPFDAPIPGQSLTDEPGNYPWEHAPKNTDLEETLEMLWSRISTPEALEELIRMFDAGVPVEAVARIITFTGFSEGEFSPDLGLMMIEPLMEMLTAIGMRAGIQDLKISLSDVSNNEFKKNMSELKFSNQKVKEEKNTIDVKSEEIPQEVRGLLARTGE
jgi:hypothetical protein